MEKERRPGRRARTVAPSLERDIIGLENPLHGSDDPASGGRARELPVLPCRNTVILPAMLAPLFIDREPALKAVEAEIGRAHV